jgi:hypothetical protein
MYKSELLFEDFANVDKRILKLVYDFVSHLFKAKEL